MIPIYFTQKGMFLIGLTNSQQSLYILSPVTSSISTFVNAVMCNFQVCVSFYTLTLILFQLFKKMVKKVHSTIFENKLMSSLVVIKQIMKYVPEFQNINIYST